jgi:hypothetical protein
MSPGLVTTVDEPGANVRAAVGLSTPGRVRCDVVRHARPPAPNAGVTACSEPGYCRKDGAPHMIPRPQRILKMVFTGRLLFKDTYLTALLLLAIYEY